MDLNDISRLTLEQGVSRTSEKQAASAIRAGARALKPLLPSIAGAGVGAAATPALLPEDASPTLVKNKLLANMLAGFLFPRMGTKGKEIVGAGALLSNIGFGMADQATQATKALADAEMKNLAQPTTMRQAQTDAARSQAHAARSQASAAKSQILAAGLGGLAIAGGLTAYIRHAKKKQEREEMAARRSGKIRVTLPTPQLDAESIVDIPFTALPESTYKGVMRDTRRRLRGELEQRKRKKPTKPAEEPESAAPAIAQAASAYDALSGLRV